MEKVCTSKYQIVRDKIAKKSAIIFCVKNEYIYVSTSYVSFFRNKLLKRMVNIKLNSLNPGVRFYLVELKSTSNSVDFYTEKRLASILTETELFTSDLKIKILHTHMYNYGYSGKSSCLPSDNDLVIHDSQGNLAVALYNNRDAL